MTTYNGGKKRLAKAIHKAIIDFESELDNKKRPYFEPFLGMGSVMAQFGKANDRELSGCDLNPDIICFWKALQNGWKPPNEVSKTLYNELKNSPVGSLPERCFVGFACSYGSQYFKGFKQNFDKGTIKNYARMGCKSINKILPYMMNVKIYDAKSYSEFKPKDFVIYCDPPYTKNQVSNKYFKNFDHELFWNIMRKWSKSNIVFISELEAPNDFYPIWEQSYKVSFIKKNVNTVKNFKEKLFIHSSLIKK